MRFFNRFKKKKSLYEVSRALGYKVYETSAKCVNTLRGSISEITIDEQKFKLLVSEVAFFFLHCIDRQAFNVLGAEQRNRLMDLILNTICNDVISEENTTDFIAKYSLRNIEYAGYEELFPESREAPRANTLAWEFGKKFAQIASGLPWSETPLILILIQEIIIPELAALVLLVNELGDANSR